MLGLWPMPPRTDLNVKITGKLERPKFTVEKIVFESMPGLYVTANLYVPKPAPKKAPTILYVCGHGNIVKDGVSYGSKTYYQHHPAWYAEHGYVSLIIDTLQLSEIPGIHHGTYREKMWWWHTLGYTPAGVECWNAMRALDYLETRPEVDPKRIGVAGRSGGGAYSWWIAATDERIACAVPVAGIADLRFAPERRLSRPIGEGGHRRPLRLHVHDQHVSLGLRDRRRPRRSAAADARQQRSR